MANKAQKLKIQIKVVAMATFFNWIMPKSITSIVALGYTFLLNLGKLCHRVKSGKKQNLKT